MKGKSGREGKIMEKAKRRREGKKEKGKGNREEGKEKGKGKRERVNEKRGRVR